MIIEKLHLTIAVYDLEKPYLKIAMYELEKSYLYIPVWTDMYMRLRIAFTKH